MSTVKTSEAKWEVVASVVSTWNYLFSSKGSGELPSLTIREAIELFETEKIKYESTEEEDRSQLIFECFECLCKNFKVKGEGKIIFKPVHPLKLEVSEKQGKQTLLEGLKK